MQKEVLIQKDYAALGGEINHELASNYVSAYQGANPDSTTHFTVGRNIIEKILAQPGCVGLRFYKGLNEAGEEKVVFAGIDASGNNIVKQVVVNQNGEVSTEEGVIADQIRWGNLFTFFGF